MTMLASQITSLAVVYSIVYSGVNQRKHQSSASLAFVREIHRGPVNFPHKWPVTRKMFPFDDVIMSPSLSLWTQFISIVQNNPCRARVWGLAFIACTLIDPFEMIIFVINVADKIVLYDYTTHAIADTCDPRWLWVRNICRKKTTKWCSISFANEATTIV